MVTQVEPITTLQRNYQRLFEKVAAGPVILTNRGTAAAVLQSVAEYDRMRQEVAYWRRQAEADRAATSDEWVSSEEVDATFAKMSL